MKLTDEQYCAMEFYDFCLQLRIESNYYEVAPADRKTRQQLIDELDAEWGPKIWQDSKFLTVAEYKTLQGIENGTITDYTDEQYRELREKLAKEIASMNSEPPAAGIPF